MKFEMPKVELLKFQTEFIADGDDTGVESGSNLEEE